MASLFLASGASLVVLTMIDFVWTTLSVKGAGPLSAFWLRWCWRGFATLSSALRAPWPLLIAGPGILLLAVTGWVALLWLGWFLIFLASPDAVVEATSNQPADPLSRLYFVGFTLTTLGVGDLKPQGSPWQLLTALAALNGLILITIAITYLLSVLSAVTQMRAFAAQVSATGGSPEAFVCAGWDGDSLACLSDSLGALTPPLAQITQSQMAYPIVDVFRSERAATAFVPAIALLDEALSLTEHGVAPSHRPAAGRIRPLRRAIEGVIEGGGPAERAPGTDPPPAPDLAALRQAGIPTVHDDAFGVLMARRQDRRRRLAALVRAQRWTWRDVARADDPDL